MTPAVVLMPGLRRVAARQAAGLVLLLGLLMLSVAAAAASLLSLALMIPSPGAATAVRLAVALGLSGGVVVLGWGAWQMGRLPWSPLALAGSLEKRHAVLMNQLSASLTGGNLTQAQEAARRLSALSEPLWPLLKTPFVAALLLGLLALGPGGWGTPGRPMEKLNAVLHPPAQPVLGFFDLYEVKPGPLQTPFGAKVTLRLIKKHPQARAEEATLYRLNQGLPRQDNVPFVKDQAVFTIDRATENFSYAFEAEGLRSPLYFVVVRLNPRLVSLAATVIYPAYLHRPPVAVDLNTPELFVPVGARLRYEGAADRPLKKAWVVAGEKPVQSLPVKGASFAGEVTIRQENTLGLLFETQEGQQFTDARKLKIRLLQDTPPTITALSPNDGLEVVESFPVEVFYLAQDDHAVSGVSLWAGAGEALKTVAQAGHGTPNARGSLMLPLSRFFPRGASGVLRWKLTARDSRGQVASTPVFSLRVLSAQELKTKVEELANESDKAMEVFESAQQDLKKTLEDLQKKARQGKHLSADDRLRLKQEIQRQQSSLKDMKQLEEKLSDAEDKLSDTPKVDQEVVRRIQQVRRAINQVLSPELQKLLAALQKSMADMPPQQMAQALQQAMQDQQKLLQALDKTLAQLKTLRQQQLVSQTERELKELMNEQAAMQKKLNAGADAKKLAQKQKSLSERIRRTEENLREIGAIAQDQLTLHELRRLPEQVDKAAMGEKSDDAAQSMDKNQPAQAKQQAQELSKQLAQFHKQLQQASAGMQARMQKTLQALVYRLAMDALQLSQQQEEVLEKSTAESYRPPVQKKLLVREQVSMGEKLNGLSDEMAELVRASLEAPMDWLALTHDLIHQNQDAKVAADNQDFGRSHYLLQNNIQTLNALARDLLAKSSSMSGGAQGGNMEQYLERLGQVAAMQQQLNRAGQKSSPMGAPGMLDMLEQMTQGQGKVRQELEKMMGQFKDFKEMNQKVNEVLKQVEEVQKALSSGDYSGRVKSRQENIHKRLLQLQTALKKQEEKEKRKGERARVFKTVPPGALQSGKRLPFSLQELLQRLQTDPYPREYQQEIRSYYQNLLRAQQRP